MTDPHPPVVIGAGPAGLAAAWTLTEAGARPMLLECSDRPCSTWHGYYPSLRMNSWRPLSSLPGMRLPPACGPWPSRDDFLDYIARYVRALDPDVRYGIRAERIERSGNHWIVRTSAGDIPTARVIVATGLHRRPHLPDWPGSDGFAGRLAHARDYRGPRPYRNRDVLVVGCGPTGIDIAVELARSGAARVRMAIRNPPLLFRLGPLTSLLSQAVKHWPLPDAAVDRASLLLHRLQWGDLSTLGLSAPRHGIVTALTRTGHTAGTIDRGLVSAVSAGAIEIVSAVTGFAGPRVLLADGSAIRPDAVIAATGQRPDLTALVGHLGVLAEVGGRPLVHGGRTLAHAPGLHFLGYRVPSGQLPDLARDARAVARAVTGVGRVTETRRRVFHRGPNPVAEPLAHS
ncbi:flavin-containing monooxygenase [Nocardia pseudobrasiliensis]|uniref:Cation diffusion facilitator CzcD-associated flavoprotein CzcO n=1 Tax=Nocardia pseudobrasiliensis TaxID=45979 RepID=A0A370I803_9NOCA|nr:NAD(P)/FAD-dependent oxidoreductase [Nocardia pseudobrasiliensis]RDI66845.1 cation diffusion facilitator CzcD-associated flavoprotein CzcO [Nocardia pseudobrasiliensis]